MFPFELSEKWASMGSAMASLMFLWAVISKYFPSTLDTYFSKYTTRLVSIIYPYIEIKFPEHSGERFTRNTAYTAIEAYLSTISVGRARKFKGDIGSDSSLLSLSMDDHEEITDTYKDVKVWWSSNVTISRTPTFSLMPAPEEKRFYKLAFHSRDRELISGSYLSHVMVEGKAVGVRKRQRKLYTNNNVGGNHYSKLWSHVPFDHPATFETLAMDPAKKKEIVDDLITFSKSKDYYSKIGKAWKRGYLLYGPPGTGKSSMVAAMANLLDYDVYDIELTAVSSNTQLRKLLIETTSKSILVIEDIDATIDLTGKRPQAKENEKESPIPTTEQKEPESKLTLSGMLNFVDGLWSACSGERLIVVTTNHVEKLDPALIRSGRMDKHIDLSYCKFDAFKVLAKNYLDIDSHQLFGEVRKLIEAVDITPADVAEALIPKSRKTKEEEATDCLEELIVGMKRTAERATVAAKKPSENGDVKKTSSSSSGDSPEPRPVENGKENGITSEFISI